MTTRIKVKPKDGLLIRHPRSMQHIPPEGKEVVLSTFIRRRIADGDLIVLPAEAPVAPPHEAEEEA